MSAELEEQGFIDKEIISREDRLDMKVYSITESGWQELHRWLSTPPLSQDYCEPFLIQVDFGGKLSDEEMINFLQHEIRAVEETLALYSAIYRINTGKMKDHEYTRSSFLSLLTLEYGIYSNQTALGGWKDLGLGLNLRADWKWYLAAPIRILIASIIPLTLGSLFGAISFPGFAQRGFGAFLSLTGAAFGMAMIKNIFEEFSWRG